jgi:hypothetical protein
MVGIGLGNGMPGWQGEALLEKAEKNARHGGSKTSRRAGTNG